MGRYHLEKDGWKYAETMPGYGGYPELTSRNRGRLNELDNLYHYTKTKLQPIIDMQARLVELVEAGKPLFVKITQGSRAGTIAKLSPSCYKVGHSSSARLNKSRSLYQLHQEGTIKDNPNLYVVVHRALNFQGMATMDYDIWLGFTKFIEFASDASNIIYEFDDRKPVKTNFKDQEYLEWMPDYEGPTVYVFTKKESVSKEEKARLARENLLPLVPIDMFGYHLEVGDKLIYARADELLFGELVKTSASGYMTIKTFIDRKEVRLQGTGLIHSLKANLPCKSLMTFDKDTNLAQKLMVEKLAKA